MRQGNIEQILSCDGPLMNCAGGIDWFGGDGRRFPLHIYSLLGRSGLQSDGYLPDKTDHDRNFRLRLGKSLGIHRHAIVARRQIIETKFSLIARGSFPLSGGFDGLNSYAGNRDSTAARILNRSLQGTPGILGKE